VLALSGFFWSYWLTGWRPGMTLAPEGPEYVRATTTTLAGIVAAQVGNAFACRTERESVLRVGLASNRLLLIGIAAEIGILLALIHVPPLARWFGLAPLGWGEWAWVLTFPPLMLGLEEARKAWVRWRSAR
jgi:P-type Ca2+ transporter type 2C